MTLLARLMGRPAVDDWLRQRRSRHGAPPSGAARNRRGGASEGNVPFTAFGDLKTACAVCQCIHVSPDGSTTPPLRSQTGGTCPPGASERRIERKIVTFASGPTSSGQSREAYRTAWLVFYVDCNELAAVLETGRTPCPPSIAPSRAARHSSARPQRPSWRRGSRSGHGRDQPAGPAEQGSALLPLHVEGRPHARGTGRGTGGPTGAGGHLHPLDAATDHRRTGLHHRAVRPGGVGRGAPRRLAAAAGDRAGARYLRPGAALVCAVSRQSGDLWDRRSGRPACDGHRTAAYGPAVDLHRGRSAASGQ